MGATAPAPEPASNNRVQDSEHRNFRNDSDDTPETLDLQGEGHKLVSDDRHSDEPVSQAADDEAAVGKATVTKKSDALAKKGNKKEKKEKKKSKLKRKRKKKKKKK